jgi:hypothetical protein
MILENAALDKTAYSKLIYGKDGARGTEWIL